MSDETRVVRFSGGAASYVAAKRTIAKHGKDNTILLFTDTKSEDADLYRFLEEAEKHLGIPVTRIADGRDIWQVFRDERYLGNSRADPCSRLLKRAQLDRWVAGNAADSIAVIGYDWTEPHRCSAFQAACHPRKAEFPLCDPPYLNKFDMLQIIRDDGFEPPRLYDLGAKHNNCGGGCVKAGHAHWKWLLDALPCVFAEWERKEQEMRDFLGKDVSILKDRRGGDRKPLTLRAFRERYTEEPLPLLDRNDWGHCHCLDVV